MPISVQAVVTRCQSEKKFDIFKERKFLKVNGASFRTHRLDVIQKYESGQTTREIAAFYDVAQLTVCRELRENGIRLRTNQECKRKYFLNEHKFDVIDNEHAAYFLGFLYADGNNHKRNNSVTVTQNIDDIDVLEKFKLFMETNRPILFYQDKRNGNKKKTAILVFNSIYLSRKLKEYGVTPNKTFTTTFPTFLRADLIKHFIRGYFDGDGSMTWNVEKHSRNIGIVGTESICKTIINIFQDELGVSSAHLYTRHPERNNNIRSIHIGKKVDIKIILNWMYGEANVFLDRKHKKYQYILTAA